MTYRIFGGKGGELGSSTAGALAGKQVLMMIQETSLQGFSAREISDRGQVLTENRPQAEILQTIKKTFEAQAAEAVHQVRAKKASAAGFTTNRVCASVNADSNNDIPTPNQEDLNGQGSTSGDVAPPTKEGVVSATPKYGKAGAGGGRGSMVCWQKPGRGGNGQGGYVCIYWDKLE